jgi:hypothetical protein
MLDVRIIALVLELLHTEALTLEPVSMANMPNSMLGLYADQRICVWVVLPSHRPGNLHKRTNISVK